jgi:hypothetical protein
MRGMMVVEKHQGHNNGKGFRPSEIQTTPQYMILFDPSGTKVAIHRDRSISTMRNPDESLPVKNRRR